MARRHPRVWLPRVRHPRVWAGFWAALAHRLSGLALAIFLPVHFLVLGLAIRGEAALEGALSWGEHPLVKAAEWGLVVALTLHLTLGLRVLVLEFLPWRDSGKSLIALGLGAAVLAGLIFLFNAG